MEEISQIIFNYLEKRVFKGKRHEVIEEDLKILLNKKFPLPKADSPSYNKELNGHIGKLQSLKELFSSRFTVLIGPAGTGKTELLKIFCQHSYIKHNGILRLAPTGKARVQLGSEAQTIAQFLLINNRYDFSTGRYFINPDAPKFSEAKTIIIDEASMLTEEQLAAIIDSVHGVTRFILVGDYRQLPPIGAGKPLFDIVKRLKPNNNQLCANGYTELKTIFRQNKEDDLDTKFAFCFSDSIIRKEKDELFPEVLNNKINASIKLVQWENANDLENILFEELKNELELESVSDFLKFEQSLGGAISKNNKYNYFNMNSVDKVENWQILTPVKPNGYGVKELNRMIQKQFRKGVIALANEIKPWHRFVSKPAGEDGFVYGDKVINMKNVRHFKTFPENKNALKYIANGEIGLVTGRFDMKWQGNNPIQITFTSQPESQYQFYDSHFKEDGKIQMELAYAITVHKSQGSGFNTVFLILPNPCRILSRELLYTALTRQRNKVIVFHQGDFNYFKRYISDEYSETARRLSDIFGLPELKEINKRIYDKRHIHISALGEFMISKSEVIIANLCHSNNINYAYEAPLTGTDGYKIKPDFTIENDDLGITFYWEHRGMLSNDDYRNKWEKKFEWYKSQGILPIEKDKLPNSDKILILTRDNPDGSINSQEIENIINQFLK